MADLNNKLINFNDLSHYDEKIKEYIENQPSTVNNGTLIIQKNGTTVATFGANQSTNTTVNIEVPTKTSHLDNDSSYATTTWVSDQFDSELADYATQQWVTNTAKAKSAGIADSATYATTAGSATTATNDGNGNNIVNTYQPKGNYLEGTVDGGLFEVEEWDDINFQLSDTSAFSINNKAVATQEWVENKKYLTSAPVTSVNSKTGAVTLAKGDIGLGNVDNTADSAKSVKYAATAGSAPASDVSSWAKASTKPSYTKSEVGLGNVDNVKQYSSSNPPPYPVTSVNGQTGAVTITAANLGLSGAMKFLGTSSTAISDGSTTGTITVNGSSIMVSAGNVVLYGGYEYVWTGSIWEQLGQEGSFKTKQSAIFSPTASGSTTAFIDTISQDANGNISATKKNVSFPVTSVNSKTGAVTLTASDVDALSDDIAITKGTGTSAVKLNSSSEASGGYALAEGYLTKAIGDYSHAGGIGTTANNEAQTTIGKYNAENANALFIVGKGSSDTDRSNAFEVISTSSGCSIKIGNTAFSETQLNYLSGLSSNVQTQLNGKAADFSIELYNGTNGNPKPVKFMTVDYSTCGAENGVAIKVSMVSGHGNGSSYAFLQDAIIRVAYTGNVEVDNFKYYGASTSNYDGANRQYGDIFWVVDSTNKVVDFYCLMGQYARLQMTPYKRVTYSTGGVITQYKNCMVYSSGDKVWANNSEFATLNDIPAVPTTKETWTFTLEDGSTVTKEVYIG